ncbi:hypothetical protein J6O86_01475 [bacterium]|nr:hypothetical protein [bacterium]
MGMAASQARWISLAARKTNVEYEGQQINQARTALSNQSSELWNRLYQMDVPVPPSTTDFTKTKYTFNIGDSTKTITDIQAADYYDPDDGITYNSYVTYTADVIEYKGIRNTNSKPQVQHVTEPSEGDPYYMVGTRKLKSMGSCDPESDDWATYIVALQQIATDWPDSTVAKEWNKINPDPTQDPSKDASAYAHIHMWKDGQNNMNFVVDGQEGCAVPQAVDTLEYSINNPDEPLHSYYSTNQFVKQTLSKYAVVEYDSSGRATTIQLEKSSAVYDLTTSTQTDDAAYNDAMNEYYYQKQIYEKRVQDINARTEQIQTEDRTLELRLKQLDTEQNALQTEMDAVHKVISKNIEGTFKTFES